MSSFATTSAIRSFTSRSIHTAQLTSRLAIPSPNILARPSTLSRTFRTSTLRLQDAAPVPVKKPVGAFRGGLLGFFLGTTLAGTSAYYYILEDYRVSNELLTEDVYAVQGAVQRIEAYVRSLEEQVQEASKRK